MTYIPTAWATKGHGVPAVCSRHGKHGKARQIRVVSAAPWWTYAFLALGGLPFLLIRHFTKVSVYLPGWTFCPRCSVVRLVRLAIAGAVLAAGMGVVAYAFEVNFRDPPPISAVGLGIMLIGYLAMFSGGWGQIARAHLSQDLQTIRVSRAAPEFRQAVEQATAGRANGSATVDAPPNRVGTAQ